MQKKFVDENTSLNPDIGMGLIMAGGMVNYAHLILSKTEIKKDDRCHQCPICHQMTGKTYIAARLPTICQNCDHIWLRG